jgi:hypothetical protein
LVLCKSADLYNKLYKKEIINGQFNQKINADELNDILQLERIIFYEEFFHDFIDDEKLNWSIDDLTPLSKLVNLKILEFENSQIKDISPLFNLLKLETLSLSRNENIEDISLISRLVNLKSLELISNKITDISYLSSLVNLEKLSLYGNEIRDISPLFNLLKLETLSLSRNENIDDNTLKELREHLPECSVRFY